MTDLTEEQREPSRPTIKIDMDSAATRGTQSVEVSYTSAWLHFFIAICLIVAWWFPVKIIMSRLLYPPVDLGPRDAKVFAALAYEGVSMKPTEVSPELFREQLVALKDAGYKPIGLIDVKQFYEQGRPLPRKAVLLTFDHSRKTSYFGVNHALRKAGWKAVMFLWVQPIVNKDPAALLWPYVRNMVRSKIWEVGAQSYHGFTDIPVDAFGTKAHFMTARMWLEDEGRFEEMEEFQQRLEEDHQRCVQLIKDKVGITPTAYAYAYPYGDFGQYQRKTMSTRLVNMGLVSKYYDLGFITGNFAVNTANSDPSRLSRLQIRPEWSGAELVKYLDETWPNNADVASADATNSLWIVDWGNMKWSGEVADLVAGEKHTGAGCVHAWDPG